MLTALAILAALSLLAVLLQTLAMLGHLARRPRLGSAFTPRVSVLKPLCGVDAGLRENLASFLAQDYPDYELLLGVAEESDPAHGLASELSARFPDRVRLVVQDASAGLNPKVNQLVSLERRARGEVVVVSDSNVRVPRGYLRDLVAPLEDARVGVVTSPIVGLSGSRLGGKLDALHLASCIAPGVAALRLVGSPVFVGKSMAFRRPDVAALGGFASFSHLLAEDQALGEAVLARGQRAAFARLPVVNVTDGPLKGFFERYFRWGLLQKHAARAAFPLLALNFPYLFCGALLAAAASFPPLATLAVVGLAFRMLLDAVAVRALTHRWPAPATLALSPLREAVAFAALAKAAFTNRVTWRGKSLYVTAGTRLVAAPEPIWSLGDAVHPEAAE